MLSDFCDFSCERGQRKNYVRFADALEQCERYFYEKGCATVMAGIVMFRVIGLGFVCFFYLFMKYI